MVAPHDARNLARRDVAMAQAIASGIPGAQLSVLDAAHLSVLEQPGGFWAALQQLLARVG